MSPTISRIKIYGIAIGFALITFVLKLLVRPLLPTGFPFIMFFAAITMSAWYGGLRAGFITTIISALLSDYFLISPVGVLLGSTPEQTFALATFVLEGTLISFLSGSLHTFRERFRLFMEGVEDYAIFMLDPQGKVASWNAGAKRIHGYEEQEIVNKSYARFFPIEDQHTGKPAQLLQTAIQEGKVITEGWRIRNDGTRFWSTGVLTALWNEAGQLRGFAKVTRDITERKETQEAIQDSESRLSGIIASAMDAIISINEEQKIILFNQAAEQIFGYSAKEMMGKSLETLLPECLRDAHKNHIRNFGSTGVTRRSMHSLGQLVGLRVTGEEFPIEATISQLTLNDQKIYTVIVRDITERVLAEDALKNFADRLQILHQIDMAILSAQSVETVAHSIVHFLRKAMPADRAAISIYSEKHNTFHMIAIDTSFENDISEGKIYRYEDFLPLGEINEPVYYVPDYKLHPDNPPVIQELKALGIRSTILLPLKTDGQILGTVSISSVKPDNFTEEHRSIAREVSAQLSIAFHQASLNEQIRRHAQELEQRVTERTIQLTAVNKELETFSYSVSHDLRAPLRVVDGYSHALLEDYRDKLDEEGQYFLERIRASTERMGELIDDMLNLSKVTRQELEASRLNLSQIGQEVVTELRQRSPEREVEFVIQPEVYAVADRRLIKIVLENLLGNAWKFTGQKDQARIEFGIDTSNSKVCYFVRDNGAGFDMQYANRLFGTFQRLHTETEFEGTGVGLATVQRIINRHGGNIWAEGKVGEGATFYFTLP